MPGMTWIPGFLLLGIRCRRTLCTRCQDCNKCKAPKAWFGPKKSGLKYITGCLTVHHQMPGLTYFIRWQTCTGCRAWYTSSDTRITLDVRTVFIHNQMPGLHQIWPDLPPANFLVGKWEGLPDCHCLAVYFSVKVKPSDQSTIHQACKHPPPPPRNYVVIITWSWTFTPTACL
jgi:hypothetical protein